MNKMMKRILTTAALLCAATALFQAPAFGQTVRCGACTHDVSYFKGKGGLIAKADQDKKTKAFKEVTWVAQCGGVVRSGKLEPGDDGIVSTLFDDDNNLACAADSGAFQLGPIDDGGWFWITDDENSAVGNLVNKKILKNPATTLANAGAGVVTAAGKGVTFLKETATGRVGILPNVLPVRPPTPTPKCGFRGKADSGTSTAGKTRITKNCAIGDGGTRSELRTTDFNGSPLIIPVRGSIVRPYSGSIVVSIHVYGNGSGHYTTDPNGDPDLGHPGGTELATGIGNQNNPFVFDWRTSTQGIGANPTTIPEAAPGTVNAQGLVEDSGNEGRLIIAAKDSYCGTPTSPKNIPLIITTHSWMGGSELTQITPTIKGSLTVPNLGENTAGSNFTIVCPSSAAAKSGEAINPAGVPLE